MELYIATGSASRLDSPLACKQPACEALVTAPPRQKLENLTYLFRVLHPSNTTRNDAVRVRFLRTDWAQGGGAFRTERVTGPQAKVPAHYELSKQYGTVYRLESFLCCYIHTQVRVHSAFLITKWC